MSAQGIAASENILRVYLHTSMQRLTLAEKSLLMIRRHMMLLIKSHGNILKNFSLITLTRENIRGSEKYIDASGLESP